MVRYGLVNITLLLVLLFLLTYLDFFLVGLKDGTATSIWYLCSTVTIRTFCDSRTQKIHAFLYSVSLYYHLGLATCFTLTGLLLFTH